MPMLPMLLAITVFQAAAFGLFLLLRGEQRRAGRGWLGLLLLLIGSSALDVLLLLTDWTARHPGFAFVFNSVAFSVPTVLYLYARRIVSVDASWKPRDWLHFAPQLLIWLLLGWAFHRHPPAFKLAYLQGEVSIALLEGPWLSIAIHGLMLGYGVAVLVLLARHQRRVREYFGNTDAVDLQWLRWTVIGCLLLWVGSLALYLVPTGLDQPMLYRGLLWVQALGLLGFVNLLVYKGLTQTAPAQLMPAAEKYAWSDLAASEKLDGVRRLQRHMNDHRPHLRSDITLAELAGDLAMPHKELSQILNECLSQSFYDFVNQHRIEDAKQALLSLPERKISDIQFDVGFNSKSSFNTAFKRAVGCTPSQFRQQNR